MPLVCFITILHFIFIRYSLLFSKLFSLLFNYISKLTTICVNIVKIKRVNSFLDYLVYNKVDG